MIQDNELITLLLSLIVTIFFVIIIGKKLFFYKFFWFSIGILFIIISQAATVIEGFYFESFFNFLEHFGYVIASVCFIVYFRNLSKA